VVGAKQMKYVRRYLQEVEVLSRTEDTENKSGVVRFKNEFGSECVMTTKQFDSLYHRKSLA
jgi:hypothetical protein